MTNVTIVIPEWTENFEKNLEKDYPDRQPPQGVMKHWNDPVSVQEQVEETKPEGRPYSYVGFVPLPEGTEE